MNDVAVHFARDGVDAEVAASALRAAKLHPRIARDDANPWVGSGGANIGRHVVYVPEVEEREAREVLAEPSVDEPEDNPVLRLVVIVALIVGLLLATPFVAQACYGPALGSASLVVSRDDLLAVDAESYFTLSDAEDVVA